MKKVAILIANYNGLGFLPHCLDSVFTTVQPDIEREVYIVDNNSTDGSLEYIAEHWPQVTVILSETNLGFAGANDLGWAQIIKNNPPEYVLLLNQDAYLTDHCLTTLVEFFSTHENAGSVQPKLLLYPDTSLVNSLGNHIHYLGFGYTEGNGQIDESNVKEARMINYCSGAAVLLRPETIQALGWELFDEEMFMYLEDLDLGWRLRLAGYRNYVVPQAIIHHQYEFSRSIRQVYYFERNRLWILLKNYRFLTLVLIFPAWLFMELGQLFFAVKNHWLKAKLRSYGWLFSRRQWEKLLHQRRQLARQRRVDDRTLLQEFTGEILFQPISSWLLRYIANPVLSGYLYVIRLLVIW